jgi:hypothetical protein
MASILDQTNVDPAASGQTLDMITNILQQHAQPTMQDVSQNATQNFQNIAGMALGKDNPYPPSGTVQNTANENLKGQLTAPMTALDVLQKAAEMGHTQASDVLNTFKEFAPDPGDLQQLVEAAHRDSQQITPQNAATWAAQKSSELGLGATTAATKGANLQDIQSQTNFRNAMANFRNSQAGNGGGTPPAVDPNGNMLENQTVASLLTPQGGGTPGAPAAGAGKPTPMLTYQGQKAPAGKMWVTMPGGSVGLQDSPGAGKTTKEAPLSPAEEKTLTDATDKVGSSDRLLSSFKPDYVGMGGGSSTIANLELSYGRNFAKEGSDAQAAANWWQDYQGFLNQVRHGIFGARLTSFEVGQFNLAAVTPNMSPSLAQANLSRQNQILRQALTSQARGAAAGGKKVGQIAELTGLTKDQISGPNVPAEAQAFLKANPTTAADFDKKYGDGEAARVLQAGP